MILGPVLSMATVAGGAFIVTALAILTVVSESPPPGLVAVAQTPALFVTRREDLAWIR